MKYFLDYRDPLRQMAMLAVTCLLVQLIVLVASESDAGKSIWIISATSLLLFAFFNAMIQLQAQDPVRYLSRSLYAFLAMIGITMGLAYGLSQGSDFSFNSIRVIYMVIAMCYIIFLVIVYLMRKIMDYAKKQDQEYE